jgi:hypothetical protein
MSGLFKGLGDLKEFIFKKILEFKDILIAIYESNYFVFIALVLIGIIIYYVLEILIGIKIGSEYRELFINKNIQQDSETEAKLRQINKKKFF